MDDQKDRRSPDRRIRPERRSGVDTRTEEQKKVQGERRSGVDRRSGTGARDKPRV